MIYLVVYLLIGILMAPFVGAYVARREGKYTLFDLFMTLLFAIFWLPSSILLFAFFSSSIIIWERKK